MPRETINSPAGPYYAKVGWDQNGSVQLGVETDPGSEAGLFAVLFDREARERLAAEVSRIDNRTQPFGDALVDAMNTAMGSTIRGVWTHLDRQGCNHLIRILRRARDTAFGRDE